MTVPLTYTRTPAAIPSFPGARTTMLWTLGSLAFLVAVLFGNSMPLIATLASKSTIPVAALIDGALMMLNPFKPAFRAIGDVASFPYIKLAELLNYMPFPITILAAVAAAFWFAGTAAAVVTAIALVYCLSTGYWLQSMTTLSLVTLAIAYSTLGGFAIGGLGARSKRARSWLEPVLDLMQTIPTFAYLIPLLVLFGFGPTVGLLASVVFAMPPMVRNTMLALRMVPSEISEAAVMAGCTPRQRFWWAEVPAAKPQILVGLNQTTMAAFAMVIIAALIGGFNDVGWEVLSNIRQARFGGSLLTGFLIVLLAVALDRVTIGAARRNKAGPRRKGRGGAIGALTIAVAICLIAGILGYLPKTWPTEWTFNASFLDPILTSFVQEYAREIAAFKSNLLIYVLLPIKIGFKGIVTPNTWGFALTPLLINIYWSGTVLFAILVTALRSAKAGFWSLFAMSFLFTGTTGMPWIAVAIATTVLAFDVGGRKLAYLAAASLAFILLSGQWQASAISVYLCGVAVILSVVFGVPIGLLAAWSDGASRLIRPVCDFFQTIPQFVFLIPVLMLFGVGDFAGLVAIVSYAVIPVIRYTEEGIRQVPTVLIEAAKTCGCTPSQSFFEVQLPTAKPVLLLGINQAILFSLGMLVIASLVGTEGLGQQIYIALSKNEPGLGLIAGIAMSLIGILTDRIIRSSIDDPLSADR